MLGQPVAVVAELVGQLREVERVAQRVGAGRALRDGGLVQDAEHKRIRHSAYDDSGCVCAPRRAGRDEERMRRLLLALACAAALCAPASMAARRAGGQALHGLGQGALGPGQLDQDDEGLVHGRQGAHPQPAEPGGVEPVVPSRRRSAAADARAASSRAITASASAAPTTARPRAASSCSGARATCSRARRRAAPARKHERVGVRPRARSRGRAGAGCAPGRGAVRVARWPCAWPASDAGRRAATSGPGAPRPSGSPRSGPAQDGARADEQAVARRLHAQAQLRVGDAVAVVDAQLHRGRAQPRPRDLGAIGIDHVDVDRLVLEAAAVDDDARSTGKHRCLEVLRSLGDDGERGRRGPQSPAIHRAGELHEACPARQVARPGGDDPRAGAGHRVGPGHVLGADGQMRRPRRAGPAADEDRGDPGRVVLHEGQRAQRSRGELGTVALGDVRQDLPRGGVGRRGARGQTCHARGARGASPRCRRRRPERSGR